MANTKSAIKAARKSLRNANRNQAVKTRLKTLAKAVKQAAAGTDAEKTRAADPMADEAMPAPAGVLRS